MFGYEKLVEDVTTFTDSNLEGCKETRNIIKRRRDNALRSCFESYTRKQKIIARSGTEAELYAAAWESVCLERNRVVVERSYEMKAVLTIDATATEHILHRQGIGKLKHIDVAYLWMQDEIRSKRLRVRSVKSEDYVASRWDGSQQQSAGDHV